jgi:putative membrane protein
MRLAAQLVTALVALEHVGFLVLELFLFARPIGLRTFKIDLEYARRTAPLAANQGLYNGFLAAGLAWSFVAAEPTGTAVRTFFLTCVVVAGLFGALTVNRRIVVMQALPAAAALLLTRLAL